MPKSGVSLDTVMIKIESNAGKSTSNIDSLSASLTKLKNSISGGFASLNNLATYLTNLNNSTQGLDKSLSALSSIENITHTLSQLNSLDTPKGFTSVVNSLKTLNKESSNLKNASDSLLSISDIIPHLGGLATIKAPSGLTSTVRNLGELSKLSGIDNMIEQMKKIPQLVEPLSSLKDIESPRGLQSVIDNLARLPEVINKFDTTAFENLKRVSEELAQSLTPLADKMMQVANGYSALSKIQNTFGKSASTSYRYMKQQKSILSSLGSIVKNVGSKFLQTGRHVQSAFGRSAINDLKKFHSKFKQVFLSLLGTRTLFTMIRKAVSEYEAFDTTLQKFSQNVWRAFGAQLAPVIEYVMNLFKQFVRVIYSVVYALTGIDLIAKANEKAMASWGSSAKDTLGTLQKFDDLNVVEFDTSKGTGDNNELIDMDKIDLTPIQKIIDWVNEMKDAINEALDTGKWYNVGKVFAEGIGEGIDWLLSKIPEIREKLFEVARSFGDFLNGVIENTNWSGIGKLITESLILIPDTITELLKTIHWDELGKGIDEALKSFDPVKIVNSFMTMIGELAVGISEAFINIEWGPVGKKIGDSVVAFFTNLSSILDKIPWNQIGQRVREAIEGIPWADVWTSIIKAAESSFNGFNEFLSGLTGIDPTNLERIEKSLAGIAVSMLIIKGTIGTILGIGKLQKTLSETSKVLDGLGISLPSVSGMFSTMSTNVGGLVSSLGGLGPTLGIIGAVVIIISALVKAFKELYNTNSDFKKTVDSLGESMSKTFGGIMQTAQEMVSKLLKILKDLWKNVLEPLFNLLSEMYKPIVEYLMEVLTILWQDILDPLVSLIEESLLFAWDKMCIAFEATIAVLKPVINVLTWLWKNILSPIVDFIKNIVIGVIKLLATNIKIHINIIKTVISVLHSFLKVTWDTIKKVVGGIANWIYSNMIAPAVAKFKEFSKNIGDIWEGIWKTIKNIINKILKGVEDFINGIINGINGLSKGLRKVGNKIFDIIGVDVTFSAISNIKIPRLETGTNEIPNEGLYHLHPGEAVVPKKYNPALGNGGSDEMNNKLDTLIDIMNNMSFTNVVNLGNEKLYEKQQSFNKKQQNKYGTINLY